VSFAAVTLCVAPQRAIPKVRVYFVINSVRKLLGTPRTFGKLYSGQHLLTLSFHSFKRIFKTYVRGLLGNGKNLVKFLHEFNSSVTESVGITKTI
jgi:hypothetical protein